MVSAYALKKLAKAGVISTSAFKKSKIKKYESEYHVPVAYVGLLTLVDRKKDWSNEISFEGTLPFKTAIGDGQVFGWMKIEIDKDAPVSSRYNGAQDEYDYNMYMRAQQNPDDVEAQTWMDNVGLRRENISDYQKVTVRGGLSYSINTAKTTENVFEDSRGGFASVEDCLDYLEQIASEGWSQVSIKVSDLQLELEEYNSKEDILPKSVTINTSIGAIELRDDYGEYVGSTTVTNDQEIKLTITAKIFPIKDIDANRYDGYYVSGEEMRNRSVVPQSYEVSVVGEIKDLNTQTSSKIGANRPDAWTRDFGREGALALEDAKDIVLQNCEEVITEWNEYTASVRNYVEQRNGKGYQRTTVNTEPWNYNYGDSYEDENYEIWQNQEYFTRIERDIKNIVDMDYSYNGPLSLRGGVLDQNDGTYLMRVEIGKDVKWEGNQEIVDDVNTDPADYNKRVLDAFLTNLRMGGYEVVSVDTNEATETKYDGRTYPILLASIVVRPTVAKSDKMKKSIKADWMKKSEVKKGSGALTVTVDIAVPESVSVGGFELEFSQGINGRYEYRSFEKGSPKIIGEFYDGWVKIFDAQYNEVASASSDMTGDGLYETILDLAHDFEELKH